MHASPETAVIFGIDPMWYAGILFAATYLLIMAERLNRAVVALSAACLMIIGGVLSQEMAFEGVDFNTLGLLTGMMIIVGITRNSGVFQYLAVWSAKLVRAKPWGILVMLMLVTATLSAFLDNVTTVLLIAPVTLLIAETLKLSAYPFLFAEIFASNIGGTATLIGDPPNIMIGSAVGLSFNDFVVNLTPIVLIVLLATIVPIYLIWGRKLKAEDSLREEVMNYNERDAIKDVRLLKQAMFVLALVIGGFVFAHSLGLEPATIAMFGASLLLVLDNLPRPLNEQTEKVEKAFHQVEWITLFFFIGLFIVVHGLDVTGAMNKLAHWVVGLTGNDRNVTAVAILWVSALASAVVDNIPFVATMIPLIKNMTATFGGPDQLMPIWWALSLGACLGGNGTLVGASANLIVAGFSERAGQPIRFIPFLLMAFPLMLLSIVISTLYVYYRYL